MDRDLHQYLQLIEEAIRQETPGRQRLLTCLHECRQAGVEVLPPDVNASGFRCAAEDEQTIRLGLSLVEPDDKSFIEDILTERRQNGAFQSLQDFCERLDIEAVPAAFLQRSIQAGLFDSIEPSRARLLQGWEQIARAVRRAAAEQAAGQMSLFAAAPTAPDTPSEPLDLPEVESWTEDERIEHEKAAVGFSWTEYLLHSEADETLVPDETEASQPDEPETTPPIEDPAPAPEPAVREESAPDREPPQMPTPDEEPAPAPEELPEQKEPALAVPDVCLIRASTSNVTEATLQQLRALAQQHPGDCRLLLALTDAQGQTTYIRAHADYAVDPSDDFRDAVNAILGIDGNPA
jgi:outer membrane biosynthesis protein TonB